ncbi:zinc carboxypeptidase [Aureitalea sp. L0-47]|uniref:M14 family metallopeptidase n=1 Tax=Aureitalea sp. L0-47 TaxID=2816962 RepID=UPI00223854F8|nr:M14 family metallopeptidase [Aureitalea sp. L0-47]MCW5519147.1 zinc carboxypeptidase [Aureitalea sp. L0-47]
MRKLLLLLVLLLNYSGFAQNFDVDLNYYLPKDVTYDKSIPTPKSVIGHEVGEWHITHDKLVQYAYALADASDRITIEDRGKTFEGRALLLMTITSPANHRNLESIRTQHLSLVESGSGSLNTSNMPVVVYQGFSIHGNEPSGSNAGLAVAYYLAAAQGPKIDQLLNNTVILFDPSFNPDGLQRFAHWANTHKAQNINPDPNDREYREAWPGGRTNHYWFDINRDWLPVQLPESRARLKTFHNWYPNILTDHHEMGTNSSFFFQPGIPSRTHPLTPKKNQELTGMIAKFHAKALDQLGSFYFSEENFDDFYYGKGSTFPDINGGVGILFEQASSRGHAQESVNGVLTFPFTIRNQFTAALSTLEAAVSLRTDLLDYQREFYNNARKEAASGGAIVFGDEKDAAKAFHLAEILDRHKIEIHELKDEFTSDGKKYKKGHSYVVPMNQRQHRLIKAMFEKRTKFQDSLFYDISAWSFPLAFNLDYIENASMSRAGAKITNLKMRTPDTPNVSTYAYLMEWHEYYSPKALNMIFAEGLRAKVAMKQFSLEGKDYDYGTILIPIQNQDMNMADLTKFLAKVSRETKVPIHGVRTGLAEGIDLGSSNFRAVEQPKVAVLVGDGVSPYDAGEIWHLFDTRYDMQLTKLDTRSFGRTDLSRYTDIIIPAGWGSALDKGDAEKLKTWVQNGGSLIAFRSSGRFLERNELMKLKFKSRKDSATNVTFEQRRDYSGAKVIGGAIFEAKLDRSHPIAFGYKNDKIAMFRNTTLMIEPDANSYNNPIQYTTNPLLSGYVSKPNLKDLANTVPFKVSNMGRGEVIYFTDNTNFRAFWYGTNKLLMNAVFFGDKM